MQSAYVSTINSYVAGPTNTGSITSIHVSDAITPSILKGGTIVYVLHMYKYQLEYIIAFQPEENSRLLLPNGKITRTTKPMLKVLYEFFMTISRPIIKVHCMKSYFNTHRSGLEVERSKEYPNQSIWPSNRNSGHH